MKFRPTPPAATWFLKLFCSKPESESVVGDLLEQYQYGRSRTWYWQQVLVIVILRLYRGLFKSLRDTVRGRPADSNPLGVAKFERSTVPIVGGGGAWIPSVRHTPAPLDTTPLPRINSASIPISGGLGAGILIVILLSGALHDLPLLRVMAVPGILAGLLFAGILRLWGITHKPASSLVMLSLKNTRK